MAKLGRSKNHGVFLQQEDTYHCLQTYLVGGFNPFERYARQIGSFPQARGENKNE